MHDIRKVIIVSAMSQLKSQGFHLQLIIKSRRLQLIPYATLQTCTCMSQMVKATSVFLSKIQALAFKALVLHDIFIQEYYARFEDHGYTTMNLIASMTAEVHIYNIITCLCVIIIMSVYSHLDYIGVKHLYWHLANRLRGSWFSYRRWEIYQIWYK